MYLEKFSQNFQVRRLETQANDYFKVLFYLKAILYETKNDSKYRDVAPLSRLPNFTPKPCFRRETQRKVPKMKDKNLWEKRAYECAWKLFEK